MLIRTRIEQPNEPAQDYDGHLSAYVLIGIYRAYEDAVLARDTNPGHISLLNIFYSPLLSQTSLRCTGRTNKGLRFVGHNYDGEWKIRIQESDNAPAESDS